MFLGVEIGGTKLQLGVGAGDGSTLVALERRDIDPAAGAAGIRGQILHVGRELIAAYPVERIGIGFGGPVFGDRGLVQTSHQITGWTGFPLTDWCASQLGRPARLGNDCDCAALAESCFGAGRGTSSLFYVTVGTGIGGGLILRGRIHGTDRPAAAEIGHLRPGTGNGPDVEALAAGPAIAASLRHLAEGLRAPDTNEPALADLLSRCGTQPETWTTRGIAAAAAAGNPLARRVYAEAAGILGWAIAQVISLLAPEIVVIGGGVSLAGEELFFQPVRSAVDRHVFQQLRGTTRIVPASLGEEVVVHGALALAAESCQ